MTVPAFVAKSGTVTGALTYTPAAAGNDVVVCLTAFNNTPALSSLANTGGEPLVADFAFASGNIAVYVNRVHGVVAGAHTFTPNWTSAPTNFFLSAIELSGVYGLDPALTPAIASNSVAMPTTNAFSPPANGDFLLSGFVVDHYLSSIGSWTGGFTQLWQGVGGPSYAWGYLGDAAGGAPISSGVSINPTFLCDAVLLAYAGAPPPAPSSLAPRRFFLPPGPGRFSGRGASGLGIGPFVTFLVKDVHRLVPRTQTPAMPKTQGAAKSTGHAALATSVRLQAGSRAVSAGRSQLATQSPLASAATSTNAARGSLAAVAMFTSASDALSAGLVQLSTNIRLQSAAASKSSGRGAPNTTVALASGSRAKLAARAQLGTTIALHSSSRAVCLTHSNVSATITLRSGGHAVSRAAATQLKRALFASASAAKSSARAVLATAKPISSRSRATSSASSAVGGVQSFSSRSSSRSTAGSVLLTGIALELDPHPGAVNSASLVQLVPARFAYSIISVQAQVPGPVVMGDEVVTVVAGSACYVTARWFDDDGNPYVPLSVTYSLEDVTAGVEVAGPAALPASAVNLVTVTGAQNRMLNLTRGHEVREAVFQLMDQLGETFIERGTYRLVRAPGAEDEG